MRKILSLTVAFALILSLSIWFTGCSGEKYDTMEAFLAGEKMQSEIASAKSTLDGSGLSLEVTSQENKLIYTYTYEQVLEMDSARDILKNGLEAEKETFQNIAEELRKTVNVENPVVIVRYLNPDGTEIYSQEFTTE